MDTAVKERRIKKPVRFMALSNNDTGLDQAPSLVFKETRLHYVGIHPIFYNIVRMRFVGGFQGKTNNMQM